MSLRLSVIGTGYLGAVHAVCLALQGHSVVGIDVDEGRVGMLARGQAPFFEPGLEELLAEVAPTGRLTFTRDFAAAADCDVHFLCVGTPQRPGSNAADTTYVMSAARELARHLRPGSLVVGKSTVPVGTASDVQRLMSDVSGHDVRLAWNPEFLREGFAINDTLKPDRLVYGVSPRTGESDTALLDEVFAPQLAGGVPRLVMDWATAELVKVAANSFLATKISFINAMARVCEASGADVTTLADAIGMDERIGRQFLNAGLGFGGGCLPKDIRAFRARADEIGVGDALSFLDSVDQVNLGNRRRVIDLAVGACGGSLDGMRVAILGAAFKPNSDDIRDSPALDVAQRAQRLGAVVTVHDPKATRHAKARAPELNYADSAFAACQAADVVLHLTEWKEYREIDPRDLAATVRRAMVIDARNALDQSLWVEAGWTFSALGRQAT